MVVEAKVMGLFTSGLLAEIVKLVESGIEPMFRPTLYQSTLTELSK